MILDDYQSISIDIPRTASSARARLFAGVPVEYHYVPEEEITEAVKLMRITYWSRIDKHATAFQYLIAAPIKFVRYFKFTFVRNPWDRMVSFYKYRKRKYEVDSFEQYIRQNPYNDLNRQQMSYMVGPFGTKMVDFVGRFEFLYEDFSKIASKIGFENRLEFLEGKKDSSIYREFYDDRTKKIVEDCFQEDIRNFNYSF